MRTTCDVAPLQGNRAPGCTHYLLRHLGSIITISVSLESDVSLLSLSVNSISGMRHMDGSGSPESTKSSLSQLAFAFSFHFGRGTLVFFSFASLSQTLETF